MPVTRNRSNCTERSQAAAPAAAEDISGPKDSSDNDETSTETEPPRRDSPDNCSICLGPFSNKSFTSSCAHSFCFICLKQWSKVKAECPLCKQSFTSIFHSIRSNDSYDIYELPPVNPPHQFDYGHFYNYLGGNLSTYGSTHHYVSFPQPRLDAGLTLSNFSRFQFHSRRYDRYFNSAPGEHQYSFSSASFNPSSHVSAASWPAGTEAFRLQVYRYHMGPPTVILGCENSNYRLTPAMVNASAHRMQRIMPWLTRELRVLLKSHQSVRLAISIIQPLLSQVTIDSELFSARVSPLIGQRSRQFIQEFIAFTNSALSMQAFDRKAMYRRRANRFWDENTSSSSSDDDDVVEITNISPDVPIPDVTVSSSNTVINLQRARWDSPTPGPSWEIMDTNIPVPHLESDRVSVSSESDPVFQPHMNNSDDDSSEAGSDIVFVKFDKPWHERSPIKLSSDSEGDGQSRKHKKLKHKKKQRETLDTSIESEKKGNKHKSLKSRSKERVRLSVSNSDDELQQGAEVNVSVSLSSDKHTRKKRRKSKDKNDDARRHKKSDRELVDRLFAEAVTQQQNVNTGSGDANIPSSSRSRDKSTGKSSGKERHKRKRKKRSRSSASPSVLSSYKKHHSGHKRSSDKHESEKRKHKRKRKSKEHAASEHTDRRTSLERESQISRNQPPADSGHSLASTHQTSYVAGADNVQHIPLNLWVTAWPSLHVTHKFPAHSASASFPSSSLAQSLPTSSGFSSHRLNYSLSEHTNSAMNSQTISSDSQSSSDSETGHRAGEHVHRVSDCSRTRQWLDINFSGVRQHAPGGSSLQITSETQNSARNWSIQNTTQPTTNTVPDACDVVSVASGDEDILVSSSASSTKSDSADLSAIDNCDLPVSNTPISSHKTSNAESSVAKQVYTSSTCSHSMPYADKEKRRKVYLSSSKNLSSPSCSSFQPFKLHKKSTLAKQNINPIFSRIAQNSDDDDDSDQPGDANHSIKLHTSDQEKTSSIHNNTLRNSSIEGNFKTTLTSSKRLQNSASSLNSTLKATVSSADTIRGLWRSHLSCLKPGEQNVTSTSSSSSTALEPVFSMLPPPQTLMTTTVSPTLTSNLSYLPYSSLPVSSTPLSPILRQSEPFGIPQAPLPPALPLHFPYPSVPSTSPTVFPAAYASRSHDACDKASGKNLAVRAGTKSSSQLLPTDGKFAIDNEDKTEFSGEDSKTSANACQQICATLFNYKEMNRSEAGSYSPERSPQIATKLTSEKSDNEIFLSSHTQDMGETEELMGAP